MNIIMLIYDKTCVALRLAAATFQMPIPMHLGCKVRLPDQSFVVDEGLNLIPSVYSICNILKREAVAH